MPNSSIYNKRTPLPPHADNSSSSVSVNPFAQAAIWVFGCPSPQIENHGGFAGGHQFGSSLQVRFPSNHLIHQLKSFHARQLLDSVSKPTCHMLSVFMRISGITTDLLVYSIVIPVLPFQLERLSYRKVSSLTGWLLCAYVS